MAPPRIPRWRSVLHAMAGLARRRLLLVHRGHEGERSVRLVAVTIGERSVSERLEERGRKGMELEARERERERSEWLVGVWSSG